MDFKVANSLLTDKVGPNHKVIKLVPACTLVQNERLQCLFAVNGLHLLGDFNRLELDHAIFDLLAGLRETVVGRR